MTDGDNLWVGDDGRAEVDFGGGQFRLAGDTNLHVSRLDDRQFALFVAQGRVQPSRARARPGRERRASTRRTRRSSITRPGLVSRRREPGSRAHARSSCAKARSNVLTAGAPCSRCCPGRSADVDGADPRYATVQQRHRHRRLRRVGGEPRSPLRHAHARLTCRRRWSARPTSTNTARGRRCPNTAPSGIRTTSPGDWAPYRNGYWADVGAWGPTWVDDAPWGYAPFHYGRWAYVGGRWGWCPGRVRRAAAVGARARRLDRRRGLGDFGERGRPGLRLGAARLGRTVPAVVGPLLVRLLGPLQPAVRGQRGGRASEQPAADALPELERAGRHHRRVGRR